ncbi:MULTISPECIES: hypothetical protein [Actinomadura]|uniref:Uncharacterized protein n=1 Tax=Actinomadura madurae TaxID=1993 RepID=A0A1I5JSR1_9ACTN|nr:hypothetical protein [Actinomadura madurae]MCP9947692.1 hypothetical protein [Actinomadura madurae]MCP9964461.1 hypothetical protein [Actinomadura madurae]MCP9976941.1 hypothetical protein [Actinomadura madurae]MCQ0011562.1 hypothetical protein [Actinomadura madurae]URM93354.1 hypothetical protein LUW76_02855 [Actinomadura madurae]
MPTITPDHLYALLASADRGAALVVIGGEATVVPADPGRGDGPEDALVITTRDAVIAELDTGANEEQIERLAQRLDVALDSLGG